MNCPCGSNLPFENCCEPLITGKAFADTAERLMRSRYTAYVRSNIDYLEKTLAPESRADFDAESAKQWAKQAQWKGLKINSTELGTSKDKIGTVEFTATYQQGRQTLDHHEVSQFRKENERWYFVDGESHTHKEGEAHHHHEKPQTVVREQPKIGRNDPCLCGSGKKYKKCCGVDAE
jgi:SEC-C motif-containing protein